MSDGSVVWIRSSLAMTRSTTVTVLEPDCLRIDIEMAFSPSSRVWLRTSSFASVMRATSPSVMTEPACEASTIFWNSRTSRSRPIVRIENSDGPAMKLPPGISVFWRSTAAADLRHRQTVGVDAIRIQQDADFAPPIAEKGDFSDVLDGFEHLLDLRVGDLRDLFR